MPFKVPCFALETSITVPVTELPAGAILFPLYRNRSKKSFSTYIYGIASLIGLFLGVISFFYYICHAFCAELLTLEAAG